MNQGCILHHQIVRMRFFKQHTEIQCFNIPLIQAEIVLLWWGLLYFLSFTKDIHIYYVKKAVTASPKMPLNNNQWLCGDILSVLQMRQISTPSLSELTLFNPPWISIALSPVCNLYWGNSICEQSTIPYSTTHAHKCCV